MAPGLLSISLRSTPIRLAPFTSCTTISMARTTSVGSAVTVGEGSSAGTTLLHQRLVRGSTSARQDVSCSSEQIQPKKGRTQLPVAPKSGNIWPSGHWDTGNQLVVFAIAPRRQNLLLLRDPGLWYDGRVGWLKSVGSHCSCRQPRTRSTLFFGQQKHCSCCSVPGLLSL